MECALLQILRSSPAGRRGRRSRGSEQRKRRGGCRSSRRRSRSGRRQSTAPEPSGSAGPANEPTPPLSFFLGKRSGDETHRRGERDRAPGEEEDRSDDHGQPVGEEDDDQIPRHRDEIKDDERPLIAQALAQVAAGIGAEGGQTMLFLSPKKSTTLSRRVIFDSLTPCHRNRTPGASAGHWSNPSRRGRKVPGRLSLRRTSPSPAGPWCRSP
jgi:hypothetical protein